MYEVGACPVWDSAWVSADPAAAPSGVVTLLALIENDQCCSLKVTTLASCSG
jgi:hypothetical protein